MENTLADVLKIVIRSVVEEVVRERFSKDKDPASDVGADAPLEELVKRVNELEILVAACNDEILKNTQRLDNMDPEESDEFEKLENRINDLEERLDDIDIDDYVKKDDLPDEIEEIVRHRLTFTVNVE